MFLSKVELYGFKSFCEKTTIEFKKGISAVVGPNGCGKSNLLDAIRWALGEQSPKALRGSKMEEIIFNGTSLRKPLNFAEVSLTFKDCSSHLKLDYDEVTITRRIYRSGEGEYFINKSACRLKDIQNLFVDTGLGREGYSILSQGRVEWLLNARPEERRDVFEEAAEIHKYKLKKNETNRRLDEMRKNMVRIKDLLGELNNMLPAVEAEAEVAKKYRYLMDKLKESRSVLYQHEWYLLKRRLEKYLRQKEELEKNKHALQNSIETLKKAVHENRVKEEKLKELVGNEQQKIRMLEERIEKLENQGKLDRQEILHIQEKLQINGNSISDIEERKQALKETLTKHENELELLADELNKQVTRVSVLNEKLKNLDCQSIEEKTEEIRDRLAQIVSVIARTDQALEDLEERKKRLVERLKNFCFSLDKKKNLIQEQINKKDKLQHELKSLQRRKNVLRKEESEIHQKKLQLDARYKGLIQEISAIKEQLNREQSSLSALQEMEKEYSGYTAGVRFLLKQKIANNGLIGTVAALLSTSAKYEIALEAALGGALQYIVAKDEQAVKNAIINLKKAGKGRVTFLPLNILSPRKRQIDFSSIKNMPGVLAPAVEIVTTDDRFKKIVDYLLSGVIVTENLNAALNAARALNMKGKFVTLEGELINPGGMITGGSLRHKQEGFLLGRERKIKEKEQICLELSKQFQERQKQLHSCAGQLNAISNDLTQVSLQIGEIEKREAALINQIELIKTTEKQLVNESKDIEEERKQADITLLEIDNKIECHLLKKQKMQNEEKELTKEWEKQLETKKMMDKEASRLQKELVDLRIKFASLQEKESTLQQQAMKQKDELHKLKLIAERLKNERIKLQEVFSSKEVLITERQKKIVYLKEELTHIKEGYKKLLASLDNIQDKKAEQENSLEGKKNELLQVEERLHGLTIDVTKLDSELKYLQDKARDELGESFSFSPVVVNAQQVGKKILQERIAKIEN
ncbi:MAG: chromosome segregation protein SMC, partial [Firmicutes bacterium]|nr:chromosome segregation protein SMC [Bacillota bacterium]